MKIVTSNANKIAEFNRFGLDVEAVKGLDLKEVVADSETVAIYKAIEAGNGLIVEDTILEIEGKEVVDIRYRMDNLEGCIAKQARWIVTLAMKDGDVIRLARGVIEGTIGESNDHGKPGVFGFDAVFYPKNAKGLSLFQLESLGTKDDFSARKMAVKSFLSKDKLYSEVDGSSIDPWKGEYQ